MYGIGSMARQCGLTASALRFYDGAGVLTPGWVDPHTGYRWYRGDQVVDARLIARLRRVGVPLNDICRLLAHQQDRQATEQLLDAHLRRLEKGLDAARRELSSVRALLASKEHSMTTTPTHAIVTAAELGTALRAVRYAASVDPELPMLNGVLIELDDATATARVVATDRYRLASSSATADITGPSVSIIVPTELIDQVLELLRDELPREEAVAQVTITVDRRRIAFATSGRRISGDWLDSEFPDHRRLLDLSTRQRASIDVTGLRQSISAAPTETMRRESDGVEYEAAVLTVRPTGALAVADGAPDGIRIGVNREFLLQALGADGAADLVLELDGPIAPLAIRNPGRPDSFSILMPVRL